MIGIGIYVKNSPKAIALYQSAFGLALGYHVLNKDGTYFHSELNRNGEPFCSVVEAKQDTYTDRHPIELGIDFDTRDELERAFTLLSDEGKVDMALCELPWSPCAAIVTDPFGVRWFLTMPQHRPAEDWSPENEA
ncbi:MAG: hypothetical protein E7321_09985 [Clostridiales bacterium]|nr:hypothetical protein [Clostridiales bacterium]